MFKPARMPVIEPHASADCREGVRWDLASSTKGDWTVGLLMGRSYDPTYDSRFIGTRHRAFRGPPEEVRATVSTVAAADGFGTKIWISRDPAQAGADQADSTSRCSAAIGSRRNA